MLLTYQWTSTIVHWYVVIIIQLLVQLSSLYILGIYSETYDTIVALITHDTNIHNNNNAQYNTSYDNSAQWQWMIWYGSNNNNVHIYNADNTQCNRDVVLPIMCNIVSAVITF